MSIASLSHMRVKQITPARKPLTYTPGSFYGVTVKLVELVAGPPEFTVELVAAVPPNFTFEV